MSNNGNMTTIPEGRDGFLLVVVDDENTAELCAWAWDTWGDRHWVSVYTGEPVVEAGMGVCPGGHCRWQRAPEVS